VQKEKTTEDSEEKENFDVVVQLEDLTDKSTDTWKIGLELSEDSNSIFSSFEGNLGKQCQVLAIV
jgi:hypothetical protein